MRADRPCSPLVYPVSEGVWVYRAQGWYGGGREIKTIPRFRGSLGILLFVFCVVGWTAATPGFAAQTSPESGNRADDQAAAMNSAELQQLIETLKDPARRAVLVTTLENLRKADTATNPTEAKLTGADPAAVKPGTEPAATSATTSAPSNAKPPTPAPASGLSAGALGTELIGRGERLADRVSGSLLLAVRGVADIPDLLRWLRGISQDPDLLRRGVNAAAGLLCVLLLAFGGAFLVRRLTHPFYNALAADVHRRDTESDSEEPSRAETADDEPVRTGPASEAPDRTDVGSGQLVGTGPESARPAGADVNGEPHAGIGDASEQLAGTDAESGQLADTRIAGGRPGGTGAVASGVEDEPPKNGWRLLRRLPYILLAASVDVLAPLAFLAVATLLLSTPIARTGTVRTVTMANVDAYVVVRVLLCIARAAFGAPSRRLRLLPVTDDVARDLMAWARRIAITIVFGYAISQLAVLFGMDEETRQGLLRMVSLLVHIMLAAMVLRFRSSVAAWITGPGEGRLVTMRRILASVWHVYAFIVIAGAWIIHSARVNDDFEQLIHFALLTLGVGLVARVVDIVLVGALDRAFSAVSNGSTRVARFGKRAAYYHRPVRVLLRLVIGTMTAIALLQAWGFDALGWFSRGAPGGRLVSSSVTLIVTLGVAVAVWEAINVALEANLDRLAAQGAAVRAARLRTIVPLLRNTLLIVLMVLILLTALSEIGVNIGPLLAGASIFGVALGFGSQKLVQDFITGIFLLVENAMRVGDFVTAAGLSGTVENLSIRTLRLRAGDGSVHVIPFSSVSTVTNTNRGLGNAAVAVTVDYEEDTDRVGALLSKIAVEMRKDDAFSHGMLSDLELWGVDRVDGATVTMAGQIVCTDTARWNVQREYNRRVKIVFQEEGIRMMPTVSMTGFRHPLDVRVERPEVGKQADGGRAGSGVLVRSDERR